MTLAAEVKRLNTELARMRWHERDPYGAAVPLRLHERETDAGGAPGLHPQFMRWLTEAGVCFCEPREVDGYMILRHHCDRRLMERGGVNSFRKASKFHVRRLQRALRQVRLIAPAEHDALFLVFARGMSSGSAMERINAGRIERGQDPYTEDEWAILLIAGTSKLSDGY